MLSEQLQFQPLELSEYSKLTSTYLQHNPSRICDWSPGSIWMWRDYFHMEYAELNETLIFKLKYPGGITAFSFQMNENYSKIIQKLKEYCHCCETPLVLCLVEQAFLEKIRIEEHCYHEKEEHDWFDYLYRTSDLQNYTGKHYATQRNHIHAFIRDVPEIVVTEGRIDPAEAKAFLDEFYAEKHITDPIEQEEKVKTYEVFRMQELYNLRTIALRSRGKIIGLAAGEAQDDTVFEHIEKAMDQYTGIYPYLAQSFAKLWDPEVYQYINREEDCGDLGLRYSKEKYRPIAKLSKYTVEICHNPE
ncbi:MAG: DUF2156 domain-containing protein [Erysipelotrichia bacterium]|nr:DUF2156 domain-containing protein [Erysipelotrichia bacterium]